MRIRYNLALSFVCTFAISITNVYATNVVVNGDFSLGNTGFMTDYTLGLTSIHGTYGIYTAGENTGFFGLAPNDHTTGNGQMYLADGATTNTMIWGQDVTVLQDTSYDFSMWAMTLSLGGLGNNSDLEVLINGSSIGPIFGTPFQSRSPWVNFTAQWSSGNNSIAEIRIFERSLEPSGNDFGLDDITLSAVPLPAGLPLFMSALGLMGFVVKRKVG